MKLALLLAAMVGLGFTNSLDVDQLSNASSANVQHPCDSCRAKYNDCMKNFCWNPPGPKYKDAHVYCHKMCSCKTSKAGGTCDVCEWRC